MNPLLKPFDTLFEIPPFSLIESDHFLPAITHWVAEARKEIAAITDQSEAPTFDNTIVALERAGEGLGRVSSILFNLNAADTNEYIQEQAQQVSPVLTEFDNEITQNVTLFNRIKEVYASRSALSLNDEQQMLLEKTYKRFVRNGALLDESAKNRLKSIHVKLARLSLTFGENLLAETNDFVLVIENEQELDGLPEDVIQRAAEEAKDRKVDGWAFTLQAPSFTPFMKYARNRNHRETMYRAHMSKSFNANEWNNEKIIEEVIKLRHEKAVLLGYPNYAAFVLEERMAQSEDKVRDLFNELYQIAKPKAEAEVEEVRKFMKQLGISHELQKWDWSFYSEQLKKAKFDFDDERLKPYFKLEKVIKGVFQTAERLYQIRFVPNENVEKYYENVQVYEVFDTQTDQLQAIFMADFFPRKGKRGGAWMTSFRNAYRVEGIRTIPQVSIVCNFTPSTPASPSLLKFDEVLTLFHEFGHALHGMLGNTQYESLSGTSVYWDFVELPSQIMENWCYEKSCLDLFARHYQTGEVIPEAYVEKIIKASNFQEAYQTVRQIGLAELDLAYHASDHPDSIQVEQIEEKISQRFEILPKVEGTCMSTHFSHIFAGGYAAGYYSYKWSEVLDADAFVMFRKNGAFDRKTADAFKEHILSKGGTEHPMTLYKRFRGQAPSTSALIERAGLLD